MIVRFELEKRVFSFGMLIVIAAATIFLFNTWHFHIDRWDDAYITFRFARNLADGNGLVWNPGGARTEGYTSFLHVALLAFGIRIGVNPWLGSLLISVFSVAATVAVFLKILRRQFGSISILAATAPGLYLIDAATAIHTTSGLETQVFAAVLALAFYAAFDFIETGKRVSAIVLALFIFLSCLCRPEAVFDGAATYLALMMSAVGKLNKDRTEKNYLVGLSISAVAVLIGGTLYAVWKYSYFGYLLPNPFYVKSNEFAFSGVKEVGAYLQHLLKWFAPLTFAAIFIVVTGQMREQRIFQICRAATENLRLKFAAPKIRSKILLTLLPPVFALCFYSTIIHEVGGAYRFSYPTYFYLALAFAAAFEIISRAAQGKKQIEIALACAAIAALAALVVSQKSRQIAPLPRSDFNRFHFQIADALAATKLGAKGSIICDAAGIIPFVSGFRQIDRVGLTDNFLSGRNQPSPAEREAYLWSSSSAADVYIGSEPPASAGAESPNADAAMHSQYVADILLKRKLTLIESRIFLQNPESLHARMRELRDRWILVGELDFPGWQAWRLKSFAYVRRASPNREIITASLQKIIKTAPEQINLDDLNAP